MLMDLCELSPSYVRSIAPYQPGKPISELAREMGLEERSIVKLASNENPRGIGPRTRAAIEAALGDIARYPDGNGFELKQALAKRYGVDMGAIVLGNGSNDVLELVALAFLGPGRAAVYLAALLRGLSARHAGARRALDRGAGEELRPRPRGDGEGDRRRDLRRLDRQPEQPDRHLRAPRGDRGLPQARARARAGGARRGLQRVPAARAARRHASSWLKRHPNLVITRTFSKAYGLAGLRVGYALAHPSVADMMNRVRQPFNVNSIALAAARAALDDMEFVARSYAENLQGLRQLEEGSRALGLDYIPSHGNFITVRVGKAAEIYKRLLRRGVIVRPVAAATGCPSTCASPSARPRRTKDSSRALAASLKE